MHPVMITASHATYINSIGGLIGAILGYLLAGICIHFWLKWKERA